MSSRAMAGIFQHSTGGGLNYGVRVGRRGTLQRMMEQKLIHSRVAKREHFFYRSPKLEIREEGLLIRFLVKTIIKHTVPR